MGAGGCIAGGGYVDPGFRVMRSQGWEITFQGVITDSKAQFRSALTSFQDSYASKWERIQTFGRMDPIPVFKNTVRTITFGWQAVAADLAEAIDINLQTSILLQLLYPSYDEFRKPSGNSPGVRLMSGAPLIRVKFANLITDASDNQGLLGTTDGITHKPILDAGFFTVADQSECPSVDFNSHQGHLYPKVVEFSCTFHPLHSHTLGVRGGPSATAAKARGRSFEPGFPYRNVIKDNTPPPKAPPKKADKSGADATQKALNAAAAEITKSLETLQAGTPSPTAGAA